VVELAGASVGTSFNLFYQRQVSPNLRTGKLTGPTEVRHLPSRMFRRRFKTSGSATYPT